MTVKQTKSNLPGAGPGRPKGLTNKATKELKAMILEALDNAGGAEYLERKANDPRTASAFLALIGKVLHLGLASSQRSKPPCPAECS